MKAAVFYGANDIRIENRPDPKPGKGQVKIKVKWCGICGTDLHEFTGGPIMVNTTPHPLTGQKLPMILGHEFSGDIVEVGEGVKGSWKVGDRVTADPCYVCHDCYSCKHAHYNVCSSLGFIGLAADGAFAEYVVVEDYQLYKLPDNVSYEDGACCEPASVALHAVRRVGVSLGEEVIVVGLGPIGLLAVQAAVAAGAAHVYGVDMSPARREGALKVGLTEAFDPSKVNVKEEILKRTDGDGCHIAINCHGNDATMRTCLDCTRNTGKIICPGHGDVGKPVNFLTMEDMNFPEKTIMGSHVYVYEFVRTLPLLGDKRISSDSIISAKISLDDIVEKGFKELVNNSAAHLKILVSPEI